MAGDSRGLDVDIREQNGVLVVRFSGRLDWSTYMRVQDVLLDCATKELVGVVVQLDDLVAESPALLVVFDVVWLSAARWPGISLSLVVSDHQLRATLESRGLPRHIPMYPTTQAALTAVVRLRHEDRVDAALPTCRCLPHVAERITERACERWGVQSLLDVAPQVAVELVSHIEDEDSPLALLLRMRADKLSVAVRTTARLDLRQWNIMRRNVASIAVCNFTMGETPAGGGRHIIWALLDVPEDSQRPPSYLPEAAVFTHQA
ncbi:STAS domain-containing protein [Lentzea terrae]|uniref:STAS domain-containing protein n=1 Tax=Lentzea terrae TaxID=2200761 RepID=UPI000DD3AF3D|nr:STAS domain-containing protein [Lentzea terrae]